MKPTLSLVMPCLDQVRFVEEAVRSVFGGGIEEFELIVRDPGSTDGSRELLQELRNELGERLQLVFEPDQGQSDAINRGFAQASGSIRGWLNSDDRLREGALRHVVSAFGPGAGDADQPAWIFGHAGIIDENGQPMQSLIARYKDWRSRRYSRVALLTENFLPQMAVFWNDAMWRRAGGLDVQRHLDMDYDLWLRFAGVAAPVHIDEVLADFRVHSDAKGSVSTRAQLRAAFETSRSHAMELGWRGRFAVALHRVLGTRTRLVYAFVKPGS
ncbi:MAG: glycosyltransferase [Planctomycetota bacterium]